NIKVCGHYGVVQRKQCASLMLKDVCILLKLAELDSSGISMIIKVHRFKLCGLIYRLSIRRQPNDLATRPKNPLHCWSELSKQVVILAMRYSTHFAAVAQQLQPVKS